MSDLPIQHDQATTSHTSLRQQSHGAPVVSPMLGLARRSLPRTVIGAAVGVMCGIALVRQLGSTYRATASVRVYERQDQLSAPDVVKLSSTNDVATEAELLQSRGLDGEVVDTLALQAQVRRPKVPRGELFSRLRATRGVSARALKLQRRGDGFDVTDVATGSPLGRLVPDVSTNVGVELTLTRSALRYPEIDLDIVPFDAAVDAVHRGVKVGRPSREASVLEITFASPDPTLARDVPNVLASRYIRNRQRTNSSSASHTVAFLRDQIGTLNAQLTAAEDSLRDLSEAEGIVNLSEEAHAGVNEAAALQARRDELEAERRSLAELLANAKRADEDSQTSPISAYRSMLASPSLLKNQALSQLLGSLAQAEDRRSELLMRRSPEDRDVQLVTARIREVEQQIRSIATTYADGLTRQVAGLNDALTRNRATLSQIPAKTVRTARLERTVKSLTEVMLQMQSRLKAAEVAESVEDASVRLVDVATLPTKPVGRTALVVFALGCLGALAGAGYSVVREYFDGAVRSEDDVRAAARTQILGRIPKLTQQSRWRFLNLPGREVVNGGVATRGSAATKRKSEVPATFTGPTLASDAYSQLQTNLFFAFGSDATRVVLFTSALPGDGKTTTAVNFASTLARRGRRVLLVDADLRRGVVARVFKLPGSPGLSEVLTGAALLSEAVHGVDLGNGTGLSVLPSGAMPLDPVDTLGASTLPKLIDELRSMFDTIVIDSSPVNIVDDALVVAHCADGVLLVGRAGVTPYDALADAASRVERARGRLLGAVLNDVDLKRDRTYGAMRWHKYGAAYYSRA